MESETIVNERPDKADGVQIDGTWRAHKAQIHIQVQNLAEICNWKWRLNSEVS